MKDSIHLANMLRRFTREKEEIRKKNVVTAAGLPRPPTANTKVPNAGAALLAAHSKAPISSGGAELADLSADPAVMSLLGAANNDLLQDMMGDLDFGLLDSPSSSPVQGENGLVGAGHKAGGGGRLPQGAVMAPPPLPGGLPGPLAKRIEDLRAVGGSLIRGTDSVCALCAHEVH